MFCQVQHNNHDKSNRKTKAAKNTNFRHATLSRHVSLSDHKLAMAATPDPQQNINIPHNNNISHNNFPEILCGNYAILYILITENSFLICNSWLD